MIKLGVNIDHVATIRQARQTVEPRPVQAAVLAEQGGADGITIHLRGDRRHIQDSDLPAIKGAINGHLNLELALGEEIEAIAHELQPQEVCLVPEHREELTTEGGLKITAGDQRLAASIARFEAAGIRCSLFVEPDGDTLRRCKDLGATTVELHTGSWAEASLAAHERGDSSNLASLSHELGRLEDAAAVAAEIGLRCNAGHGITYRNVRELLHLPLLHELNIGHTIVSRAVLVGMERAVREMKDLIAAGPC
jgi:pyridoxine 5-phosphate synthase